MVADDDGRQVDREEPRAIAELADKLLDLVPVAGQAAHPLPTGLVLLFANPDVAQPLSIIAWRSADRVRMRLSRPMAISPRAATTTTTGTFSSAKKRSGCWAKASSGGVLALVLQRVQDLLEGQVVLLGDPLDRLASPHQLSENFGGRGADDGLASCHNAGVLPVRLSVSSGLQGWPRHLHGRSFGTMDALWRTGRIAVGATLADWAHAE